MKLLPKIARGDRGALEQFYAQQKTRVYRLVLSMTGDPYLAEDLTQETFLRVQESAGTYRRDISETAWVVAIARNLTYDALRRQSREIINETAVSMSIPVLSDTKEQSGFMFLDMIQELTQAEQELVCLRILAELSWREIGRITGQSADAGRKRYTRALEKLRKGLISVKET